MEYVEHKFKTLHGVNQPSIDQRLLGVFNSTVPYPLRDRWAEQNFKWNDYIDPRNEGVVPLTDKHMSSKVGRSFPIFSIGVKTGRVGVLMCSAATENRGVIVQRDRDEWPLYDVNGLPVLHILDAVTGTIVPYNMNEFDLQKTLEHIEVTNDLLHDMDRQGYEVRQSLRDMLEMYPTIAREMHKVHGKNCFVHTRMAKWVAYWRTRDMETPMPINDIRFYQSEEFPELVAIDIGSHVTERQMELADRPFSEVRAEYGLGSNSVARVGNSDGPIRFRKNQTQTTTAETKTTEGGVKFVTPEGVRVYVSAGANEDCQTLGWSWYDRPELEKMEFKDMQVELERRNNDIVNVGRFLKVRDADYASIQSDIANGIGIEIIAPEDLDAYIATFETPKSAAPVGRKKTIDELVEEMERQDALEEAAAARKTEYVDFGKGQGNRPATDVITIRSQQRYVEQFLANLEVDRYYGEGQEHAIVKDSLLGRYGTFFIGYEVYKGKNNIYRVQHPVTNDLWIVRGGRAYHIDYVHAMADQEFDYSFINFPSVLCDENDPDGTRFDKEIEAQVNAQYRDLYALMGLIPHDRNLWKGVERNDFSRVWEGQMVGTQMFEYGKPVVEYVNGLPVEEGFDNEVETEEEYYAPVRPRVVEPKNRTKPVAEEVFNTAKTGRKTFEFINKNVKDLRDVKAPEARLTFGATKEENYEYHLNKFFPLVQDNIGNFDKVPEGALCFDQVKHATNPNGVAFIYFGNPLLAALRCTYTAEWLSDNFFGEWKDDFREVIPEHRMNEYFSYVNGKLAEVLKKLGGSWEEYTTNSEKVKAKELNIFGLPYDSRFENGINYGESVEEAEIVETISEEEMEVSDEVESEDTLLKVTEETLREEIERKVRDELEAEYAEKFRKLDDTATRLNNEVASVSIERDNLEEEVKALKGRMNAQIRALQDMSDKYHALLKEKIEAKEAKRPESMKSEAQKRYEAIFSKTGLNKDEIDELSRNGISDEDIMDYENWAEPSHVAECKARLTSEVKSEATTDVDCIVETDVPVTEGNVEGKLNEECESAPLSEHTVVPTAEETAEVAREAQELLDSIRLNSPYRIELEMEPEDFMKPCLPDEDEEDEHQFDFLDEHGDVDMDKVNDAMYEVYGPDFDFEAMVAKHSNFTNEFITGNYYIGYEYSEDGEAEDLMHESLANSFGDDQAFHSPIDADEFHRLLALEEEEEEEYEEDDSETDSTPTLEDISLTSVFSDVDTNVPADVATDVEYEEDEILSMTVLKPQTAVAETEHTTNIELDLDSIKHVFPNVLIGKPEKIIWVATSRSQALAAWEPKDAFMGCAMGKDIASKLAYDSSEFTPLLTLRSHYVEELLVRVDDLNEYYETKASGESDVIMLNHETGFADDILKNVLPICHSEDDEVILEKVVLTGTLEEVSTQVQAFSARASAHPMWKTAHRLEFTGKVDSKLIERCNDSCEETGDHAVQLFGHIIRDLLEQSEYGSAHKVDKFVTNYLNSFALKAVGINETIKGFVVNDKAFFKLRDTLEQSNDPRLVHLYALMKRDLFYCVTGVGTSVKSLGVVPDSIKLHLTADDAKSLLDENGRYNVSVSFIEMSMPAVDFSHLEEKLAGEKLTGTHGVINATLLRNAFTFARDSKRAKTLDTGSLLVIDRNGSVNRAFLHNDPTAGESIFLTKYSF